jgi:hypothetical protein
MLTNLRLADLRLATAQQRSTGQNLLSPYTTSASGIFQIFKNKTGFWAVIDQMMFNSSFPGYFTKGGQPKDELGRVGKEA